MDQQLVDHAREALDRLATPSKRESPYPVPQGQSWAAADRTSPPRIASPSRSVKDRFRTEDIVEGRNEWHNIQLSVRLAISGLGAELDRHAQSFAAVETSLNSCAKHADIAKVGHELKVMQHAVDAKASAAEMAMLLQQKLSQQQADALFDRHTAALHAMQEGLHNRITHHEQTHTASMQATTQSLQEKIDATAADVKGDLDAVRERLLQKAKAENAALKADVADLHQALDQEKLERVKLGTELASVREELQGRLGNELADLRGELLQEIRAGLAASKASLDGAAAEAKHATEGLRADTEAGFGRMRQALATLQDEVVGERGERIEAHRGLEAEHHQTKADLQQAKADLQQTKADLQQTKPDLQQTKADLQQTKADLQQTKADLQQTKAGLQQSKADLQESKEQSKADLQKVVSEAEEQQHVVQRHLDYQRHRIEANTRTAEALRQDLGLPLATAPLDLPPPPALRRGDLPPPSSPYSGRGVHEWEHEADTHEDARGRKGDRGQPTSLVLKALQKHIDDVEGKLQEVEGRVAREHAEVSEALRAGREEADSALRDLAKKVDKETANRRSAVQKACDDAKHEMLKAVGAEAEARVSDDAALRSALEALLDQFKEATMKQFVDVVSEVRVLEGSLEGEVRLRSQELEEVRAAMGQQEAEQRAAAQRDVEQLRAHVQQALPAERAATEEWTAGKVVEAMHSIRTLLDKAVQEVEEEGRAAAKELEGRVQALEGEVAATGRVAKGALDDGLEKLAQAMQAVSKAEAHRADLLAADIKNCQAWCEKLAATIRVQWEETCKGVDAAGEALRHEAETLGARVAGVEGKVVEGAAAAAALREQQREHEARLPALEHQCNSGLELANEMVTKLRELFEGAVSDVREEVSKQRADTSEARREMQGLVAFVREVEQAVVEERDAAKRRLQELHNALQQVASDMGSTKLAAKKMEDLEREVGQVVKKVRYHGQMLGEM